jgi:hypothetical protein
MCDAVSVGGNGHRQAVDGAASFIPHPHAFPGARGWSHANRAAAVYFMPALGAGVSKSIVSYHGASTHSNRTVQALAAQTTVAFG